MSFSNDGDRGLGSIPEPPRDGGRREAAHHIMGEIVHLAALARRHELGLLGYLLDMARLEAEDAARHGGSSD